MSCKYTALCRILDSTPSSVCAWGKCSSEVVSAGSRGGHLLHLMLFYHILQPVWTIARFPEPKTLPRGTLWIHTGWLQGCLPSLPGQFFGEVCWPFEDLAPIGLHYTHYYAASCPGGFVCCQDWADTVFRRQASRFIHSCLKPNSEVWLFELPKVGGSWLSLKDSDVKCELGKQALPNSDQEPVTVFTRAVLPKAATAIL